MPPKKKTKPGTRPRKTKFLKSDKLRMVSELKKEVYADILDICVTKLRAGEHLKLAESRRKFVEELAEEQCSDSLSRLLNVMVEEYLILLETHVKRKGFAHFQQAWFSHIEKYMYFVTDAGGNDQPCCASAMSSNHSVLWKALVDRVESNPSQDEQRIVVSTIAYIVYDQMTEKVKDYKAVLISSPAEAKLELGGNSDKKRLSESNVSLHRYGGFALHSLLKKYAPQGTGSQHCALNHQEASCRSTLHSILNQLKIIHNQMSALPDAIHYLNRGGLDLMNTCMLPYLRAVIEKVSSFINEDKRQEFGPRMIAVACKEVEGDAELFRTFMKCIQETGVDVSASTVASVISRLHQELCKKMFHARINEFMTASIEIELEECGKAVKVEQSLRDGLKTFSGLKTRTCL